MANALVRVAPLIAGLGLIGSMGAAHAADAGKFARWGSGDSGKAQVSFNEGGTNTDTASASVVDATGAMYVAGTVRNGQGVNRFGVIKLTPDGDLDNGFSGDGRATSLRTNVIATSVALSADGEFVYVAGYTLDDANDPDAIVCRFRTSNGTYSAFPGFAFDACPTTTFFDGAPDRAFDIAVQPDGRIVLAGDMAFPNAPSATYAAFSRFESDGKPDFSFGALQGSNLVFVRDPTLYAAHTINAVALAPDGRIVGAGSTRFNNSADLDGMVVVLNKDGSEPNTSENGFEEDGLTDRDTVINDVHMMLPADGEPSSILLAGRIGLADGRNGGYLAKMSVAGAFDLDGFGTNGAVKVTPANPFDIEFTQVAQQADGKIIVAGMLRQGFADSDIQVRRYSTAGVLDQNFGINGTLTNIDFGSPDGNNVPVGLSVLGNAGAYIGASVLQTMQDTNYAAAKLELDTMFADGFEE